MDTHTFNTVANYINMEMCDAILGNDNDKSIWLMKF